MSRVVLAMSGGVDSSVAAHLLLAEGHEVIGVFMRHGETIEPACAVEENKSASLSSLPILPLATLPETKSHKQGCCSASDAEDARRVAEMLEIDFYALDFQTEFGRIIDYFVEEYSSARTPNPCIMCNNWVKFGKLFEYADSVNAKFVATGHYARCQAAEVPSGTPALLRGLDNSKDQSYVLFGLRREHLSRIMLPVGEFRKDAIRQMAAEIGLRVANKRDSQEICFVTSGKHGEFVRSRRGDESTAGEIVTTAGQVVGTHLGFENFTIGQRKGLGVALGDPRFVVRIDRETNRVYIGEKEELERTRLTANQTNWLVDPPVGPFSCHAKFRYNTPSSEAIATVIEGDRLHIEFAQPVLGVAPGQAVVCYDGPRVLGGGWIE